MSVLALPRRYRRPSRPWRRPPMPADAPEVYRAGGSRLLDRGAVLRRPVGRVEIGFLKGRDCAGARPSQADHPRHPISGHAVDRVCASVPGLSGRHLAAGAVGPDERASGRQSGLGGVLQRLRGCGAGAADLHSSGRRCRLRHMPHQRAAEPGAAGGHSASATARGVSSGGPVRWMARGCRPRQHAAPAQPHAAPGPVCGYGPARRRRHL